MKAYEGRPTRWFTHEIAIFRLSLIDFFFMPLVLRSNEITLTDSQIVPFGLISDSNNKFFDIESSKVAYYPNRVDNANYDVLGNIVFEISTTKVTHSREVYNIFDLIGDYGGFRDGIYIVIFLFLGSYSEHHFLMKAIQKMYFAQTEDSELFTHDVDGKTVKRVERLKKAAGDARHYK